MNNSDCHNEKIKRLNFRNIVKVPNIGKPCIDYKTKIEQLVRNYVEDFKVIFSTVLIHLSGLHLSGRSLIRTVSVEKKFKIILILNTNIFV